MKRYRPHTSQALPLLFGLASVFAFGTVVAEDTDFELKGDPEQGRSTYQLQCVTCHGQSGIGDGPAAAAFDPSPSDLTREDLSAEEIYLATRDGGQAVGLTPLMPAFRHSLDEQTIHDVVAYTLTLREE
ncbi:MAG: c-type cytochrome [Wenzhouxiangella sp.]